MEGGDGGTRGKWLTCHRNGHRKSRPVTLSLAVYTHAAVVQRYDSLTDEQTKTTATTSLIAKVKTRVMTKVVD